MACISFRIWIKSTFVNSKSIYYGLLSLLLIILNFQGLEVVVSELWRLHIWYQIHRDLSKLLKQGFELRKELFDLAR